MHMESIDQTAVLLHITCTAVHETAVHDHVNRAPSEETLNTICRKERQSIKFMKFKNKWYKHQAYRSQTQVKNGIEMHACK
jgi:hypothetical protein